MYRIYLKQEATQVLLPVTPAEIRTKTESRNKSVYILNFGELNLARKPGLQEISFTVLLPGRLYSFVQTEGAFHEPEYFLNLFREYKAAEKPVQLIVFRKLADGSQIFCGNIEALLEDYMVTEKGGEQGDFWVDLRWKEYRNAKSIRYDMKKEADGQTALIEQGQARESKTPTGSYTVRSGDCLWAIAKRALGDGTKYREIAEKNGIADPSRIYPGQVLKL